MKNAGEDILFDFLEQADIGGTNATSAWLDMKDHDRVHAIVELGSWDSGDDLDECRLEQATSSGGAGVKDLTTDGTGLNYDTANPIDANGDQVQLSARAEDLDVDGGFQFVRLFVGEAGNTGVDNVFGFIMLHGARYPVKELNAAAVTGSKVYVTPDS